MNPEWQPDPAAPAGITPPIGTNQFQITCSEAGADGSPQSVTMTVQQIDMTPDTANQIQQAMQMSSKEIIN